MSRRKQENPQPRKRLINAEAELLQDTLTCGSCQKVFVLSEIVKFIQHKVHSCNKENNNFIILDDGRDCRPPEDSDHEDSPGPLVAPRAPSISAPICNRKGLHHQHHHLHRNNRKGLFSGDPLENRGPKTLFGGDPLDNRGPKNMFGGDSLENRGHKSVFGGDPLEDRGQYFRGKDFEEDKKVVKDIPVIKQEVKDPSLRCSPKMMVNAYTNTIITEPSTYTCSTCKQTFTSAWVLVQHAQHMHGMKIYLVTPYHGSRSSSTSAAPVLPPTGPPPSLINSNSTLGIPLPPVLPPCSINGPTHHHHSVLPLENHPALQLLRMPLGERQFPPTSLNAPSLFTRPPSQDFRVDMLATSSATSGNNNSSESSQQFHRLNHHPPHLPPHSAPSLPPGLGIGSFEPHNPFIDRGPLGLDTRPRQPPMSLGFEPQMDFYSQRLRQLAGATSPTAVPASPRKLTPPFTHPPMSSSSQPSTPTSTPQPVLNLHNSTSRNTTPAPNHQHNSNNPAHRGSSASSTSSKGGGVTDVADGSPKLLKSWSCEFCGKAFRFQSNLIVHRRSHTGEKPYKCPICRHSCSQASKLKRHMKTHQENNGKSTMGSENNSLASPRSTPDSTSETGKDANQDRPRSLDEDEDASDGQTADNEEEEEDLDDEDEEEEDELDDEDLDDSMMAEDLSTRGPNSSTPVPRGSPCSDLSKTPKISPEDVVANNDNSSNTISVSNGENGTAEDKESLKPEPRHSLLSEVMDKIGLSNIQQYNEAYKKALEESSMKNSPKEETEKSSKDRKLVTENGPERLNSRDDIKSNLNNHGNNNKNSLVLHQHSMEFGHGFFGAFDYNHHHHHNAYEASKRLKLDLADHLRNSNDRDSLYAGLWLPSVHGGRDVYDLTHDLSRHNKSSSSESALKSVTPTNMCNSRSMSPRPGTSGGGQSVTPIPNLLVNNSSKSNSSLSSKEQRRNDTCEYCGKVFKNCSNLTVHRRSHTGEKPYKCELCSYACAQSSKLTRHMKTHGRLGKDVYRCRFCDMPFSVPSTLEKHMRKCVVNQNASGVAYMDRDSDSKELTS